MISHVYKPKRSVNGKVQISRLYRGRIKLSGDLKVQDIPLRTSDKQVAEKRLAEIIKERQQEAEGIIAPKSLRTATQKALQDHYKDYETDLTARGCSKSYIKICNYRFVSLIKQTDWTSLRDVTLDSFYAWRSRQKLAAKTLNEYAILFQAFLNWMERKGSIATNPFKHFTRIETNGREVRQRRAFSDEELTRLLSIQTERRIVYLTAVYTGLRRGELAALRWNDICLDTEKPYIQVRAAISKNKKNATLPLHSELVAELRKLKVQSKTEKVFEDLMPKMQQFKKDLEAAGIPYKDELGRQADFHSLRKTLATNLNKMGVAPRVAMELMRHSDIKLTMKNYTDSSQLPTFTAVEQLPWLTSLSKHTQIDTQILDTVVHDGAQSDTMNKKGDALEASVEQGSWHGVSQSDTVEHIEKMAPQVV